MTPQEATTTLSVHESIAAALDRGDGRAAIRISTRSLRGNPSDARELLRHAGVLIDAGSLLARTRIVRRAIELLGRHEQVLRALDEPTYEYFVANAFLYLGQRERGRGAGTKPSLNAAIGHLASSARACPSPPTTINLAGALIGQGRAVEALDLLEGVLAEVPDHPVALFKRAEACRLLAYWMQPHQGLLEAAATDFGRAKVGAGNDLHMRAVCDRQLASLGVDPLRTAPRPLRRTPVQRWILTERLALNVCPLCAVDTPCAYDMFALPGQLHAKHRRPPIVDVVDMMNSLHRSFGAARLSLMLGVGVIKTRTREQVIISSGGAPTARHDSASGLVAQAASAFYSLFGQIAFALSSYMHIDHPRHKVTFDKVWGRSVSKPIQSRADLHPAIRRVRTPALNALYSLARSLDRDGGIYAELRELRNSLEHHLVVIDGDRASPYFVAVTPDRLQRDAIALGRLARAALIYFGGVVWRAEYQRLQRAELAGEWIPRASRHSVERIV